MSGAVEAYVHVQCAGGKIPEVLRALRSMEGEVLFADAVTGDWDILAKTRGDDLNALGRLSLVKISDLPGVNRVSTANVINVG